MNTHTKAHRVHTSARAETMTDLFIFMPGNIILNSMIAPLEVALRFAFEANPRICYEMNNYEIPFGCHAWEKYDKEFWLPYLLPNKTSIPSY
jgi:hypothetical protein